MQIYLVGGAVRDMLMEVPCNDCDFLVVGATPDDLADLTVKLGLVQVGQDFPVYLARDPMGHTCEVALARIERKTRADGGYNDFSVTTEGVTLEDDLKRRDLTINSMALPVELVRDSAAASGWRLPRIHELSFSVDDVIDPYDGKSAIQRGELIATSDAFAEDPVRMLRAVKFAIRYGYSLDALIPLFNTMIAQGLTSTFNPSRINKELVAIANSIAGDTTASQEYHRRHDYHRHAVSRFRSFVAYAPMLSALIHPEHKLSEPLVAPDTESDGVLDSTLVFGGADLFGRITPAIALAVVEYLVGCRTANYVQSNVTSRITDDAATLLALINPGASNDGTTGVFSAFTQPTSVQVANLSPVTQPHRITNAAVMIAVISLADMYLRHIDAEHSHEFVRVGESLIRDVETFIGRATDAQLSVAARDRGLVGKAIGDFMNLHLSDIFSAVMLLPVR